MKAKHRAILDMTPEQLAERAQWLTYDAVKHIIGKGRTTIHGLVKDGTLEKIGHHSSARISLKSVLAYIEKQREIAQVAQTLSIPQKQAMALGYKRAAEQKKLAQAMDIVDAGEAQAQAAETSNEVIWVEVKQPDGSVREVGITGTVDGKTAQQRADALRASQRSRFSMVRMSSAAPHHPGHAARIVSRYGLGAHWPSTGSTE